MHISISKKAPRIYINIVPTRPHIIKLYGFTVSSVFYLNKHSIFIWFAVFTKTNRMVTKNVHYPNANVLKIYFKENIYFNLVDTVQFRSKDETSLHRLLLNVSKILVLHYYV